MVSSETQFLPSEVTSFWCRGKNESRISLHCYKYPRMGGYSIEGSTGFQYIGGVGCREGIANHLAF